MIDLTASEATNYGISSAYFNRLEEEATLREALKTDINCQGCKHDRPGDCGRREWGEDGYLHFPEGNCYEIEKERRGEDVNSGETPKNTK